MVDPTDESLFFIEITLKKVVNIRFSYGAQKALCVVSAI